jgi:malonyl-CoA decarboxylase
VFYSISNCQTGLAGISFGNPLIKQVVEELKRELPKLTTFVTLSPVPGFAQMAGEGTQDRDRLPIARRGSPGCWSALDSSRIGAPMWREAQKVDRRVLAPLRRALFPRPPRRGSGSRPLDRGRPLSTSATAQGSSASTLAGDLSATGLRPVSTAFMVNYLYELSTISRRTTRPSPIRAPLPLHRPCANSPGARRD